MPEILFVPLVGFTPTLARLGQGGGHYDRWLAEHPPLLAIGLAWDAQACEALPTEPHGGDPEGEVAVQPDERGDAGGGGDVRCAFAAMRNCCRWHRRR